MISGLQERVTKVFIENVNPLLSVARQRRVSSPRENSSTPGCWPNKLTSYRSTKSERSVHGKVILWGKMKNFFMTLNKLIISNNVTEK